MKKVTIEIFKKSHTFTLNKIDKNIHYKHATYDFPSYIFFVYAKLLLQNCK